MLFDAQNLFTGTAASPAQAITASAASTNSIDTQLTTNLRDEPVEVYAQVTEAFTADGAATLTLALQDSADNSSFSTILTTAAIGKATLVAGYRIPLGYLPKSHRRYLQLYATVAIGPMTAGKIIGGLVLVAPTNDATAISTLSTAGAGYSV